MCSITLTLLDLSHAALWEEELLDGLLVCPLALVMALVPCVLAGVRNLIDHQIQKLLRC